MLGMTATNKNEVELGQAVFDKICSNCHAEKPVIPLGAPRFGNQSDWEARMSLTPPTNPGRLAA
jgi:cytochrome c5